MKRRAPPGDRARARDCEPLQRRWRDVEPPRPGDSAREDERIGALLGGVADPGALPPARLEKVWFRLGRKLKLDFDDLPDDANAENRSKEIGRAARAEHVSAESSSRRSIASHAWRSPRPAPLLGLRSAAIALVLLGTGGVVLARREVAHVLTLVAARLDPDVRPDRERRAERPISRRIARNAPSLERAGELAGVPDVRQPPAAPAVTVIEPGAPEGKEPTPPIELPESRVTSPAPREPKRGRMLALERPSSLERQPARPDPAGRALPQAPVASTAVPERPVPVVPPSRSGAPAAWVGDLAIAPPTFVARVDSPARPDAVSRSVPSRRAREPVSAPPGDLAAETRLVRGAIERMRTRGDALGALANLDQHRSQFPNGLLRTDAEMVRVEALLALGRDTEALLALERQDVGSLPRAVELQLARGELRANRDCRAAIGDFDHVWGQNASSEIAERALRGRAICRLRLGQQEAAEADLRAYLERFPNGKLAAEARRRVHR